MPVAHECFDDWLFAAILGIAGRACASHICWLPARLRFAIRKAKTVNMPKRTACRFLAVCLLLISGCKVGYFHAETTLHPDGSVDRAILQPVSSTPEAALKPGVWDESGMTSEKSFAEFSGGIRDLKLVDEGKDYFAAWKTAESAADLPNHYTRLAVDEETTSRFKRRFVKRDYGLLTEYSWQETLTDVVTLEDFGKARQEFIDLLCEVVEPTLEESLGEEHDTSKLMAWLRGDGSEFVIDATNTLYDVASSKVYLMSDEAAGDAFKQRIIKVCEKHGFGELFDQSGKFQEKAVRKLAMEIVQENLPRSDGMPVEKDVIRGVVGATGLSDKDEKTPVARSLSGSWNRAVAARPGGKEQFETDLKKLATRLQGVHGGFLLGSPEDFRFVMNFPGVVVETNGVILDENRVRWQFSAVDAWPSGLSMRGRSLLDSSDGIKGLEAWQKSLDRNSLTRLLDLIDGDEWLIEVLQKCRKANALTPLEDFRKSFDDADLLAAADRILKLLTRDDRPAKR